MRLTKKRLAQLNAALSLDDVLYEKFRRLSEDLARREKNFAQRKNFAVYRLDHTSDKKHEVRVAMEVVAVESAPGIPFTTIIVR